MNHYESEKKIKIVTESWQSQLELRIMLPDDELELPFKHPVVVVCSSLKKDSWHSHLC